MESLIFDSHLGLKDVSLPFDVWTKHIVILWNVQRRGWEVLSDEFTETINREGSQSKWMQVVAHKKRDNLEWKYLSY